MKYDVHDDKFFYDIINNKKYADTVILLDFWSLRCEYCRIAAPAVDYIHSLFSDKLILLKIECERFPYIVSEFNVRALPIQHLLIGNKKMKEYTGVVTITEKISEIEKDIKKFIKV